MTTLRFKALNTLYKREISGYSLTLYATQPDKEIVYCVNTVGGVLSSSSYDCLYNVATMLRAFPELMKATHHKNTRKQSVTSQILQTLDTRPRKGFTCKELVRELGVGRGTVSSRLSSLRYCGKIKRVLSLNGNVTTAVYLPAVA
jgi:hypothetical protein